MLLSEVEWPIEKSDWLTRYPNRNFHLFVSGPEAVQSDGVCLIIDDFQRRRLWIVACLVSL